MIRAMIIGFLTLGQSVIAQEILSDRVWGFRVYGSADAGFPVISPGGRAMVVEFDVMEDRQPDLFIRAVHCDRDWNPTNSYFVNDNIQNRSKGPFVIDPSPAGVKGYRYHYSARIPGISGLESFRFSGNYLFEIVERETNAVLARGRFFVVEQLLTPSMKVSNRLLPGEVNPYNQVNKIELRFALPGPEALKDEVLYPLSLSAVDIYRNRQLGSRWRIDPRRPSQHTFVDGLGTTSMRFWVDNVAPGNDYRRIDLRDATDYPPGQKVRARRGADVSRFQQPPAGDHNGVSTLIQGTQYADYLPFRFELASDYRQYDQVFVVGDFNGWVPSPGSAMVYDDETHRYVWETPLRRGAYDYQYVVGPNDWIALEGNDWRTTNVYSAMVYYHDDRLGGYDRIIAFVQRKSAGGFEHTTD